MYTLPCSQLLTLLPHSGPGLGAAKGAVELGAKVTGELLCKRIANPLPIQARLYRLLVLLTEVHVAWVPPAGGGWRTCSGRNYLRVTD